MSRAGHAGSPDLAEELFQSSVNLFGVVLFKIHAYASADSETMDECETIPKSNPTVPGIWDVHNAPMEIDATMAYAFRDLISGNMRENMKRANSSTVALISKMGDTLQQEVLAEFTQAIRAIARLPAETTKSFLGPGKESETGFALLLECYRIDQVAPTRSDSTKERISLLSSMSRSAPRALAFMMSVFDLLESVRNPSK